MSAFTPNEIAAAFVASCRDEVEAPKPGNVHTFAGGHDMEARHFLHSARVAAPAIAAKEARVGARIRKAVEATFAAVGMNTNLGIILLCAPLARAAESQRDVQTALAAVLNELDSQDATDVYAAIARASPGGLGRAPRYDVHDGPPASLLDAMREAADRDMIARQYVTGFADVFGTGLSTVTEMQTRGAGHSIALAVYLFFLSRFPDTHVVRKHGLEVAAAVMHEAQSFAARFCGEAGESAFLADLLAFDARLKAQRINPGTNADLAVATLFAARLTRVLPISAGNG